MENDNISVVDAEIKQIGFPFMKRKNIIGNGSNGTVYQERYKKGLFFAYKCFKSDEEFRKELSVYQKLKHGHIVPFLEAVYARGEDGETISAIKMFKMSKGSLEQWIFNPKFSYSIYTVICWMEQMFAVLDYLKKQGVVHRDIKPQNILVGPFFSLFFADFGTAKDNELITCLSYVGSERYMCPEMHNRKNTPSFWSDIYSLGLVCWEIIERRFVFDGIFKPEIMSRKDLETIENQKLQCPDDIKELVYRCTKVEPDKRIYADKAFDTATKIKERYEKDCKYEFLPEKVTNNKPLRPIGYNDTNEQIEILQVEADIEYAAKHAKDFDSVIDSSDLEEKETQLDISESNCQQLLARFMEKNKKFKLVYETKAWFRATLEKNLEEVGEKHVLEVAQKVVEYLDQLTERKIVLYFSPEKKYDNFVNSRINHLSSSDGLHMGSTFVATMRHTLCHIDELCLKLFRVLRNLQYNELSLLDRVDLQLLDKHFHQIERLKSASSVDFFVNEMGAKELFRLGSLFENSSEYFVDKEFYKIYNIEHVDGKDTFRSKSGHISVTKPFLKDTDRTESVSIENLKKLFEKTKLEILEKLAVFEKRHAEVKRKQKIAKETNYFQLSCRPESSCDCEVKCPIVWTGFVPEYQLRDSYRLCQYGEECANNLAYQSFTNMIMRKQCFDDLIDLIEVIGEAAYLKAFLTENSLDIKLFFNYAEFAPEKEFFMLDIGKFIRKEGDELAVVPIMNGLLNITWESVSYQEVGKEFREIEMTQLLTGVIGPILDEFIGNYSKRKELCPFLKDLQASKDQVKECLQIIKSTVLEFFKEPYPSQWVYPTARNELSVELYDLLATNLKDKITKKDASV